MVLRNAGLESQIWGRADVSHDLTYPTNLKQYSISDRGQHEMDRNKNSQQSQVPCRPIEQLRLLVRANGVPRSTWPYQSEGKSQM